MNNLINNMFWIKFDGLSWVMTGLILFVSLSVGSFSIRYLKGDKKKSQFFTLLICVVLSNIIMVSTDHIFVLLTCLISSNTFLVFMMLHKGEWPAARYSAFLAAKNFIFGALLIGTALFILQDATQEFSINIITEISGDQPWAITAGLFLLLGAMTQSGLLPFSRWLVSSLNSPTPVSAIMHAGLVNAGGFILVRFSELYANQTFSLEIIFLAGTITAIIGTFWKLVQSDVKRMLACSTVSQMGFMILQCGLGLFPAAIAHLCWHGLFKSYLFLATGSVAQEKRVPYDTKPRRFSVLISILYGGVGAIAFALLSGKDFDTIDTRMFLIAISFIATTHFSLAILREGKIRLIKLIIAFIATVFIGSTYGLSVHLIETILNPDILSTPQPLNILHVLTLVIFIMCWGLFVFSNNYKKSLQSNKWAQKLYVFMINASEPHAKTITSHHNHYRN